MANKRKNKLTPTGYDEVSVVDVGAAEDADILIMKSGIQCVGDLHTDVPLAIGRKKKKNRYGNWVIVKAEKKPPAKKTTSKKPAKKKEGGTSDRAENWKEDRHPRVGGEWAPTSSDSKKKYGKGGTTAANLGDKDSLTSEMNSHITTARARIKAEGGDNKANAAAAKKKGSAAKTAANKKKADAKRAASAAKTAANKKASAAKSEASRAKSLANRIESAKTRLANAKISVKYAKTPEQKERAALALAAAQKSLNALTPQKKVKTAVHKSFAATLLTNWIEGKVAP